MCCVCVCVCVFVYTWSTYWHYYKADSIPSITNGHPPPPPPPHTHIQIHYSTDTLCFWKLHPFLYHDRQETSCTSCCSCTSQNQTATTNDLQQASNCTLYELQSWWRVEIRRMWTHSKAEVQSWCMCSVKLNTFVRCSNIVVHSSKQSHKTHTNAVFITSKWYYNCLCIGNSSLQDVADLTLSRLTDHPDRIRDFPYSFWTDAKNSMQQPFPSKSLPT
jgi:hypothetical protein